MEKDNNKLALRALILLVVFLSLLVIYSFALKPMINGYVVKSQNEGVEFAIVTIAQKAANCEQVPLFVGNQTVTLVALECLQQEIPVTG